MKLPKSLRAARREVDRVVQKVLKLVDPNKSFEKKDFKSILNEIVHQIHMNRSIEAEEILKVTEQVVAAISTEYANLPEHLRGWEAIITFIYIKYHQELGIPFEM
jgi:D-ribose pyranose/furanose isomerase RbsD